ncbi:MAG: hypothetical protein NPIRA03_10020 [Nitrospirales bacterium]|nr:MAG: hypothetical protein NPIRA03_10020 [Nitrospirales bacterium]
MFTVSKKGKTEKSGDETDRKRADNNMNSLFSEPSLKTNLKFIVSYPYSSFVHQIGIAWCRFHN